MAISRPPTKPATWDVSGVVADAAGEELMRRILLQLPPGYELLFGRAGAG
jgi:hypothetical protein